MAGIGFGEGLRKLFLAGVGAIATGAEKSQQIIDDFVKKGESTIEQGKAFNEELTRKAAKAASDTQDSILRAHLQSMTAEERAAYAQRIQDLAAEIDDQATTVESEVEEAEEAAEAAAAAEAADETADDGEQ